MGDLCPKGVISVKRVVKKLTHCHGDSDHGEGVMNFKLCIEHLELCQRGIKLCKHKEANVLAKGLRYPNE